MNIEDRVAKLLALAESANENEAAAAAERAAELIERYNLDRAKLGQRNDSPVKVINLWTSEGVMMPRYISYLGPALEALFEIRIIRNKIGTQPNLRAFGRAVSLDAAKTALHLYMMAIESGVQRQGLFGLGAITSYKRAAAGTIQQRAKAVQAERERNRREAGANVWGLVRYDQAQVDVAVRAEFSRIKGGKSNIPFADRMAAHLGHEDGERIPLHNAAGIGGRLAIGQGTK